MAAELAARSYRLFVRLVTDGIDYHTIRTMWQRVQHEKQRRERQRREPRPRPLPYVDPEDPGEATSVTIPRAPPFSAHEPGTAAGVLRIRRWVLLGPLARVGESTGFGGRADFDISYHAPPGLSTLHLSSSVADVRASYDLASFDGDGGLILLRVRYADPDRVPTLSYVLCDTATRRATPVTTSFAPHPQRPGRVGVIRCANSVMLAELEEGHGEFRLRVIVFPDPAEPFVQEALVPIPEGAPHPWGSHAVLTHGACIYFIGQTTGLLRFNPDDPETLLLIPFSEAPAGQQHARYVGLTDGVMMLAEVDQGTHLRIWAFSGQWEQRHLVIPLPVCHRFGFPHPIDPKTVYLITTTGIGQRLLVRAHLETGACRVEGQIPGFSASHSRLIAMEWR
ncbi:hypothetical protein ZWY2020_017970 [Hordeum vulgare]|nr:hypothetical protein ZWY2020_017970 [Hordeum vulgare]